MSTPVIVYVLTALAAVVVVLTRLRLRRGRGAARVTVGRRLVDLHTVAGVLGVIVWTVFLVAPEDGLAGSAGVGIVGLGLFWVVALAGLAMLVRWVPARGRHASSGPADQWSSGPWLSLLGHLGMVASVVVFTYAYLTSAV